MHLDHKPTKTLVCGASGTGKTTYAVDAMTHWSDYEHVWWYDHQGEASHRKLGDYVCASLDGLATGISKRRLVCYDPAWDFPGRAADGFRFFCSLAMHAATRLGDAGRDGKKLLVCDEIQQFVDPQGISHELAVVLETGRRWKLDCLFVTQSPNLIHTRIRNQLTRVVAFRAIDDRALRFLEDCGIDAQKVRNLGQGEFWGRSLVTGEVWTSDVIHEMVSK